MSEFEFYSQSLANWIEITIEYPNAEDQAAIPLLWDGESWGSIIEKFRSEGSSWIVWWHDGVRAYARLDPLQPELN